MFQPSVNRLCGFLEISSLFIALARSGGAQYKAGNLRIQAISNNGGGFGRKSAAWKERRSLKWCAVRESYLVVLEAPGEVGAMPKISSRQLLNLSLPQLAIWDVFLIDSDFKIERPKRYYRQGLDLFHSHARDESGHPIMQPHYGRDDNPSVIGSIRSRVSKLFGRTNASRPAGQGTQGNTSIAHDHDDAMGSSSSWSLDTTPSRPPTPMLDPSTNTNPLLAQDESPGDIGADIVNQSNGKTHKKGKKRAKNVSKHTFYIENSQTRLKLFARNEVCCRILFLSYISTAQSLEQRQMLQWITALEKVAATSHYAGRNRFDSFAPIRLNVSAQWLVDGVRLILSMESEPRFL